MQTIALFAKEPEWGGAQINLYKLGLKLQEAGFRVVFICNPHAAFARNRIVGSAFPQLHFSAKGRLCRKEAPRVVGFLREQEAEIVLTCESKVLYHLAWLKQFYMPGLPTVFIQGTLLGKNKKNLLHHWVYGKLNAAVARLDYIRDNLSQRTPLPKSRIWVIPHTVDTAFFAQAPTFRSQCRQQWALPAGATVVGMTSRVSGGKRHDLLVAAAAELVAEGHDLHLAFFGKSDRPDLEAALHAQIAAAQLQERVHFFGFVEDIRQAYAAMDIFVIASDCETIGMVTVEALAAGLPIVGTDRCGSLYLLNHGEAGLLFRQGEAEDLKNQLKRLLEEEGLQKKLKEKALLEAKQYDKAREVAGFQRLFQEIK